MRHGRLVAFTGAMTTEGLGYCSWKELTGNIASQAQSLAEECESLASVSPQVERVQKRIVAHCADLTSGRAIVSDVRVHFSILRDAFSEIDAISHPTAGGAETFLSRFDKAIARLFKRRQKHKVEECDAVSPLLHHLGIRRFATLNYDFEIERQIFLDSYEKRRIEQADGDQINDDKAHATFSEIFLSGKAANIDGINRIHRHRPDGISAESDAINRARPDRLFEFAIGSAEADYHVMHLHGRADMPANMVLDIRDYDRLYRRDDLQKRPFQHGLRMLHAGNPVLFVGLGMKETEINDFLQNFVSQTPYRRTSPAFFLWNTLGMSSDVTKRRNEMALKRADFLQRLGVFIIYDEDFSAGAKEIAGLRARHAQADLMLKVIEEYNGRVPPHDRLVDGAAIALASKRKIELEALATTLRSLPYAIDEIDRRSQRIGAVARTLDRSVLKRSGLGDGMRLWGTIALEAAARESTQRQNSIVVDGTASTGERIHFFASSPGTGRGLVAEWLFAEQPMMLKKLGLSATPKRHTLLVNAGFAYDADAILNGIRHFFYTINGSPGSPSSREEAISSGALFEGKPARVILNGIDRFFGVDGAPLSAEIDLLLRSACAHRHSDVEWLLLGTERLRNYADCLGQPIRTIRRNHAESPSVYLSHVQEKLNDRIPDPNRGITFASQGRMRFASDSLSRETYRRAFFSAHLSPHVIDTVMPHTNNYPSLAYEILKALAFIGDPVEEKVLIHCNGIRQTLLNKVNEDSAPDDTLSDVVSALVECGLVLTVDPFKSGGSRRLALHRTLVAEQREQRAVPLSEAMLSSSFNMSLFAAQPSGDYVPEAAFHDELGSMVDRLIGAWHDVEPNDEVKRHFEDLDADARLKMSKEVLGSSINECAIEQIVKLAHPDSSACLRAALSIIRGYFSTSSLLQLDCGDRLVCATRDGALSEHADRLDRLLTSFGNLAAARDVVRIKLRNLVERPSDVLGPEPFYWDDIVWLHNERGVVKQTQGDLYAAHRSFRLAAKVNREKVEQGYHGHNWRRITINVVGVLIERGRMTTALKLLDEIEQTINRQPAYDTQNLAALNAANTRRFDRLVTRFGAQDGFVDNCLDHEFTREEILIASLVLGYRGLIAQNEGREKDAADDYVRAISIARRLDEKRIYALFQRHYATLRGFIIDSARGQRAEDIAVAAAEACAHRDMAYRARLLSAKSMVRQPGMTRADRRKARHHIKQALTYAEQTDTHRVRIEALAALSRMMLDDGEMDGALSAACDAMALSCRYGDMLHKISLRVQMGEILIVRGDPKSGQALLDRAGKLAARIGYFRVMERIKRIEHRSV